MNLSQKVLHSSLTLLHIKQFCFLSKSSMQSSLHKKSFTLIEMLIVIVIIGILAAALVPRLQDVQARARDTKRKADLQQITTAIQLYTLDKGKFPSTWSNCSCYVYSPSLDRRMPRLQWYVTSLPVDPINTSGNLRTANGWYHYLYGNIYPSNESYSLTTKLENPQDPDRASVKNYYFYQGSWYQWSTYHSMLYEVWPKRFWP